MPTNTLTDTACRKAAPEAKPRKLFDGHGLYLSVSPSGHKGWRWSYRWQGKPQTYTIGDYPLIGLADARKVRDGLRILHKQGVCPKSNKAPPPPPPPRELVPLKDAVERYWDGRQDTSAKYRLHATRALTMHLYPTLGDMHVGDITKEALMVELNRMNAQGKFVYVRKVHMWVRQVLGWAVAQGYAKTNVAKDIQSREAFGKRKVQSLAALELTEVRRLVDRLAVESREREIQSVLACKLLALTWVRTGELRMMLWSEIDYAQALWRIPKDKMKRPHDHLVPLTRQALVILEKLRERSRGSVYVFPNDRRQDRPMSENAVLYLLHRIGFKGEMTGHGWRSVASTWANEHGYDDDAIERQLAHVPEGVRGIYNRSKYLKPRRRFMQAWADWLDDPDTAFLDDLDDADASGLES